MLKRYLNDPNNLEYEKDEVALRKSEDETEDSNRKINHLKIKREMENSQEKMNKLPKIKNKK